MEENSLRTPMDGEEFEAFYREILREFGPGARPAEKKRVPARKRSPSADREKRIRMLAAVLCLECTGIAATVLWWMVRWL